MGFDLSNGFHAGYMAWGYPLTTAEVFGWKPQGTLPPRLPPDMEMPGPWNGGYFTSDFQIVTDEDARALSAALYRALDLAYGKQPIFDFSVVDFSVAVPEPETPDCSYAERMIIEKLKKDAPTVLMIEQLARKAAQRGFSIG